MKYDVVVVGGGIAGLTAAAYLSKRGKSVALFEQQQKLGGLVQTFERDLVYFDGGLRAIENSGIVFPMLRQLGIDLECVKSTVSIGLGNQMLVLESPDSLISYEAMLKTIFPGNTTDIDAIMKEIRKIMGYMKILYNTDNPLFLDPKKDSKYLIRVVLPQLFKYLTVFRKLNDLNIPVEVFLRQFTNNQALVDLIAQHFFQQTPASFALGYFNVYLDYFYPKGGTAMLVEKLEAYFKAHGGVVFAGTPVDRIQPEEHILTDAQGNQITYSSLIWAGDTNALYHSIDVQALKSKKLATKIEAFRTKIQPLKGCDSVFSVYLTIDEKPSWFSSICTGHCFYTPQSKGLSKVDSTAKDAFLLAETAFLLADASQMIALTMKQSIKAYLRSYCSFNTFEIAIPALRDPNLAPEGKTGVVVSLLFDYQLAKKLDEMGWSDEFKVFLEQLFIEILDEHLFVGIMKKVSHSFSSSPLTIERLTGNTHGGITGWAFSNPVIPAENRMNRIAQSVETELPDVYQAGQWTFSPSGLPTSILTGKLAADRIR